MMNTRGAWIAVVCLLVWGATAQAEPLGVPDIYSSYIRSVYDADTDSWTTTYGKAQNILFTFGGSTVPISSGTFSITANIDDSGIQHGGTLLIGGSITTPAYSNPLLSGDLVGFGYTPPSDPVNGYPLFEFDFAVSGGSLASAFGGSAAPVTVRLSDPSLTGWSGFGSDFQGTILVGSKGRGQADTFSPIPEPMSACMMLASAGMVVLSGCRRRLRGGKR